MINEWIEVMKNKTFIVTGASQGIGKATALSLAKMGAEVIVVCRDFGRGQEACREIIEESRNPLVHLETADLSSLEEIEQLGDRVASRFPLIHGLINNHAALFNAYTLSPDGIEMTFALNHLAYFSLTLLLLENIERAAGRVVNVSARVHENIEHDFLDNLCPVETYNPWAAYCQSKLANILFTYALARKIEGSGVTVNCLHPGTAQTLALKTAREIYASLHGPTDFVTPGTLEAAAGTSLFLATAPEVDGISGKFFIDCRAVPSSHLSYNESLQEKLWELSYGLVATQAYKAG
jgi:NAD(P)-dependent dehydrogenase (short-subunit alcohol dehydrogenase family)